METSLRYSGDYKALRFHIKEKYPIDNNSYLEFRGELDTKFGHPTYGSAAIRQFLPDFSTTIGVGVHYDAKARRHNYVFRAKKEFSVSTDGLFNFCVKARGHADQEFRRNKYDGAAEFIVNKFNFKEGQDLRFKVGYKIFEKLPYLQIQENNWTFNADIDGRWNVRYHL